MKKFYTLILPLIILSACSLGQVEETQPEVLENLVMSVDSGLTADKLSKTGLVLLEDFQIGEERFLKVGLTSGVDKSLLNQIPGVRHVTNEIIYTIFNTPTDPLYSVQYSAQNTDLESAWDQYSGDGIVVAVVDSGVNNLHEDLGGEETFAIGYNAITGQSIPVTENSDDNGHGTHVAGIIAAQHNDRGIAGVAPDVKIMPVKVIDANGSGSDYDIAQGITSAVINGADVINLSLGGPGNSYMVNEAINYALLNSVVVVVASGNDSQQKINYPAAHQGVITVAASNGQNTVTDFSTRASYVDITAPGENIISLSNDENDGYLMMSGTSMAAPFISGVVALMLEKDNSAPSRIKYMLQDTAVDIEDTGVDPLSGFGLVDCNEAVSAAIPALNHGSIGIITQNYGSTIGDVLIYLKNASGNVIASGLSDSDGDMAFHNITSGDYSLEASYFGETLESGSITVGSGFVLSETLNFSVDLLTFNTGPSLYETNGVDAAMFFVIDNGVDTPFSAYYIDDTMTSLYPSLSIPVETGIDYYVGFTIPSNSSDDWGYFSMHYTLGSELAFTGDATSNREYPKDNVTDAYNYAALSPDTSYYGYISTGLYDEEIYYLDFSL